MAAQEQGARYRYYKRLLLDIGTRLGREDIQALVVTQDLPDDLKTASGVGVLRMLEKGGLFSDRKISPLAELLRGISRHDLTNNYVQEYSETFRSRGDSPDVDVEGTIHPSPMKLDIDSPEKDCPLPPPSVCQPAASCDPTPDVSLSYLDLQQLVALVPPHKLQNTMFSRNLEELINKLAGEVREEQQDCEGPHGTEPGHRREENSRIVQQHVSGSYTRSSGELHKGPPTQRSSSVGSSERMPLAKCFSASAEALVGADHRQLFQLQTCEKCSSLDSSLISPRPRKAHSFSCETPVADMQRTALHRSEGQHGNMCTEQQGAIKRSRIPPFLPGSKGQKGSAELKDAVTISWKEKRGNFVGPIFFHKNKCFQKRVKVSAGSGPTRLNLNVNFKLYPNGINWDQDSYSTLKIEATSPSSQILSSDAHLQLSVTGTDPHTGNIITAQQAEWPLHEKAHIMKEFLAHDIIKVSSAQHFEFQATLRVKFSLSKDWVVVDTVSSMP